jgi:hypothetical protein
VFVPGKLSSVVSLVQKLINYGQKSFYNIGPEYNTLGLKALTVTNTLAYYDPN